MERMSVVQAIGEALSNHRAAYSHEPAIVLVGPSELQDLVTEMNLKGSELIGNVQLQVFGLIVVPKCGNGIDFAIDGSVSERILVNRAYGRTVSGT